METEINLEFFSETKAHLTSLERQLKQIHDVDVGLLVPKDTNAPTLIAIGIKHGGPRALAAAQQVAQTLYSFIHNEAGLAGHKQLLLVTNDGDRVDIAMLSAEEIERNIVAAREGER
jgi:hypothetical protein